MKPIALLRATLAALTLAAAPALWGQTLLGGADFSAKLPAGFSVNAGVEYRSAQWLAHTNQWSVEAGAGYKPLKWLKLSAGYKFIQARSSAGTNSDGYNYHAYWDSKHRVSVSLTGQWKPIGRLTLSLRERYQYTYRPDHLVGLFNEGLPWGNRQINAKAGHILRSRLQAGFKPRKKSRYEFFANFELYTQLSDRNITKSKTEGAKFCDKWRIAAGSEYKINRHNSLELFYRYAHATDEDSPHTIGLVYSFSL